MRFRLGSLLQKIHVQCWNYDAASVMRQINEAISLCHVTAACQDFPKQRHGPISQALANLEQFKWPEDHTWLHKGYRHILEEKGLFFT